MMRSDRLVGLRATPPVSSSITSTDAVWSALVPPAFFRPDEAFAIGDGRATGTAENGATQRACKSARNSTGRASPGARWTADWIQVAPPKAPWRRRGTRQAPFSSLPKASAYAGASAQSDDADQTSDCQQARIGFFHSTSLRAKPVTVEGRHSRLGLKAAYDRRTLNLPSLRPLKPFVPHLLRRKAAPEGPDVHAAMAARLTLWTLLFEPEILSLIAAYLRGFISIINCQQDLAPDRDCSVGDIKHPREGEAREAQKVRDGPESHPVDQIANRPADHQCQGR